jgi:hypothetical protein
MVEGATAYVEALKGLPFIDAVHIDEVPSRADQGADALVRIRAKGTDYRYLAEIKSSHLTYAVADELAARAHRKRGPPRLLLAPYIGKPMAQHLKERGLNFVDRLGNCWVVLGHDHIAEITGRTPGTPPEARMLRAPAYRALFALLAKDENVSLPVRELAELSGASRAAVGKLLQRLDAEGFVGRTKTRRVLLNRRELLDRFVHGYAEVLRPSLVIGRYEMQEHDPFKFEERVEAALGKRFRWAWSGLPAAYRLEPHYRGETSAIVIDGGHDVARELKLAPSSRTGRVALLRPAGPLTFEGVKARTVHPLLVYAELLAVPHERTAEEAAMLREKLPDLFRGS